MTARIARTCVFGLSAIIVLNPPAAGAPLHVRTVAVRGQQPPGLDDGRTFLGFTNPILNNAGQTAFESFLGTISGGYDGSFGVWSEAGGQLGANVVGREQAPGTAPGTTFNSQFYFVFNDQGKIAVKSTVVDPSNGGSLRDGIWLGTPGHMQLVALSGDVAPSGFGDTRFVQFDVPVLNRQGTLAFAANFDGAYFPNFGYQGIWTVSSGPPQLAVITEQSILGGFESPFVNLGNTPFFEIFVPPYRPGLTSTGHVVFNAYTVLTSEPGDNGMWTNAGDPFQLIMPATGSQAPGLAEGVLLGSVRRFVSNDTGQFVFSTLLAGAGVMSANSRSLWVFHGDQPTMVAREGDQADGLPAGVRYQTLFQYPQLDYHQDSLPSLNNAGQIAFVARLAGTGINASNDTGIWRTDTDGQHLQVVALTGQQAPGVAPGFVFSKVEAPLLNSLGRIAFRGDIVSPETSNFLDTGIWAEDAEGVLRLIARTGDTIDVDPGPAEDLRTIRELSLSATSEGGCCGYAQPGSASAFNDFGQIAFRVVFTDSAEAVVVSNLVAVPEPLSGLTTSVLFAGAFGVGIRRRRTP